MASIVVALDPAKLVNPNLDVRYLLPDEIERRSAGTVQDDGYDYSDYSAPAPALLLYLETDELEAGLAVVIAVIENVELLGNSLRDAATVAIADPDDGTPMRAIYPPEMRETNV